MYERAQVDVIAGRMAEEANPLIQVVVGPRQTGKSTMIAQALQKLDIPYHFVSSDDAVVLSRQWLETEWQQARNMLQGHAGQVVLVIDETQKVPHWPIAVKSLYDDDRRNLVGVKVVLSGLSSLLLHKGLEDSLMGRFELIRSPHWSYTECSKAFGYSLSDYLYYGGYPGASRFAGDDGRWSAYLRDAVIEPTISQDVLAMQDVRKPALMRALFRLGATYSAQELSYNKMLGQLQDAGNTVTLAHYLELLSKAGMLCGLPKYSEKDGHHGRLLSEKGSMLCGLPKYSEKELERRASSPRLMVYDTSLMTAVSDKPHDRLVEEPDLLGRLVESSVGARLLARSQEEGFDVMWWREGNDEVDFVLRKGRALSAIEVRGGHESSQSGMAKFLAKNPQAKRIVVGGASSGAVSVEDFLLDRVPLFY